MSPVFWLPLIAGLAPRPQFRRRDALSVAAAAATATTFSPAGRPPFVEVASAATAADAFAVSATLSPTVALATSAVAALTEAERRAPRVGIGAWAWGDSLFWKYDPANDEELREVFDFAVDQGVQFFDTAEVCSPVSTLTLTLTLTAGMVGSGSFTHPTRTAPQLRLPTLTLP